VCVAHTQMGMQTNKLTNKLPTNLLAAATSEYRISHPLYFTPNVSHTNCIVSTNNNTGMNDHAHQQHS
jgi:hypothetical protein